MKVPNNTLYNKWVHKLQYVDITKDYITVKINELPLPKLKTEC